MKTRHARWRAASWVAVLLLVGCGGGGGGTSDDYALQDGHRAMILNGESPLFTVSGSCSGTAWQVSAPAVLQSFEGTSAYMVANSNGMNLSNCPSDASVSTGFYDTRMLLLARIAADGSSYSVVPQPSSALADRVHVGDTGHLDTMLVYTDSGKSVTLGYVERSYVIEPRNADTAIANFVAKHFDSAGRLLLTQQDRYRMDHDGTLYKLSVDLQYSSTSTRHLLLTRI